MLSCLVLGHCQSQVPIDIFPKIRIFTLCWKHIFEHSTSKCSHLKTIWWKFMKPTANSHWYPIFSYAEKSCQKYLAFRELCEYEVLTPCGRLANEVIHPYPLYYGIACPWLLTSHNQGGSCWKVCFSTNTHSRSVVLNRALESWPLMVSMFLCSSDCHKGPEWEGELRELLGGRKENNILPHVGSSICHSSK